MPRKPKKEDTEEEIEEEESSDSSSDVDESEEGDDSESEEGTTENSQDITTEISDEGEQEDEKEEIEEKAVKNKKTGKPVTPSRKGTKKIESDKKRLVFRYYIIDKNYTYIYATKKEIAGLEAAIRDEINNQDDVQLKSIKNDGKEYIDVEVALGNDNEEKENIPYLIQHEINVFGLKPEKREVRLMIDSRETKLYDKKGTRDHIEKKKEETHIFYITKDDAPPEKITDKDEKAIIRQLAKYFDDLNKDDESVLPVRIEVNKNEKIVSLEIVEGLGSFDEVDVSGQLVEEFAIENVTVDKYRLGLSELDPNRTSRKDRDETILALVIISGYKVVSYYFVDEDLLKGKYSTIYKRLKADDTDETGDIDKILNRIDVTNKLSDPEFRYRIGERIISQH